MLTWCCLADSVFNGPNLLACEDANIWSFGISPTNTVEADGNVKRQD